MAFSDLLAAAIEELATTVSVRAGLGYERGAAAANRADTWLLRVAAGGLAVAGICFGVALLWPGRLAGALLGYCGLGVTLLAVLGWASLLAIRQPPKRRRGRGA